MNTKSVLRTCIFKLKDSAWSRSEGEEAQRMIANVVERPAPAMIARFGAVEIKAMTCFTPPFGYYSENTHTGTWAIMQVSFL